MQSKHRPGVGASIAKGVALGGILIALYWSIGIDMVAQWSDDPNYSHGFLVPVFSGFFAWQKRRQLQELAPRPSWLGLAVLLAGVAMLILGAIGAENFLARSSLVVVIAGLVLFHLGGPILRGLAFPLAYLLFMVPLPQMIFNAVAFPLQTFATQNATVSLEILGVPVLRDGNVIHLARMTLGVTEACSGIRSLISLLALAAAFAYVSLNRGATMALLVASAIPITIMANAARIVLTGLIGQSFGVRYAEGFFHEFSGWLLFLLSIVPLFGVQRALSRLDRMEGGSAKR